MFIRSNILCALALMLLASCADDRFQVSSYLVNGEEAHTVECQLGVNVGAYIALADQSRGALTPADDNEEASAAEKHISDLWVFQYSTASGELLIQPRYYTITDQAQLDDLPVLLADNVESVVYVVTNTHSSDWVTTSNASSQFGTVSLLLEQTIPDPTPILPDGDAALDIPMMGYRDNVIIEDENTPKVLVPVYRMYAKIKINLGKLIESLSINAIEVQSIPWICYIGTRKKEDQSLAGDYPIDTYYITRSFKENSDRDAWYEIYVPENIKGESSNNKFYPEYKPETAPDDALQINFHLVHTDEIGAKNVVKFTVFPGGNNYDNFNIERNCVYRITADILVVDSDIHIPSSNCFVVDPGDLLGFEPYYRIEDGGYDHDGDGYSIIDWLAPDDPDKAIVRAELLWQTEMCVGDNSAGNLVWYNASNQKIYVQTNKETDGNAVVAAYNAAGEIIWSWHIWSTNRDPGDVPSAEIYTTYKWDTDGIYGVDVSSLRVPGYALMPCNLGALDIDPDPAAYWRTYGLWYQWGRKDPLPSSHEDAWYSSKSAATAAGEPDAYYATKDWSEIGYTIYDNSHQPVTISTKDQTTFFHAVIGSEVANMTGEWEAVRYTINNPTLYLCGMTDWGTDNSFSIINPAQGEHSPSMHSKGDWYPYHDDKLWGGLVPTLDGSIKYYAYTSKSNNYGYYTTTYLMDNYGTKSIFDPCPKGWRVPPPELWLEFTEGGGNPSGYSTINYDDSAVVNGGMYMYIQGYKTGKTSYFSTPGSLFCNGTIHRVGICGNYHNATATLDQCVNCMHVHYSSSDFRVFENNYYRYWIKSLAGPIRCVRDTH